MRVCGTIQLGFCQLEDVKMSLSVRCHDLDIGLGVGLEAILDYSLSTLCRKLRTNETVEELNQSHLYESESWLYR
jgi:hypothetical protein